MKYRVKAQYPIYWTKWFTIDADDVDAAIAKCKQEAESIEAQSASPIHMGWEVVEANEVKS